MKLFQRKIMLVSVLLKKKSLNFVTLISPLVEAGDELDLSSSQ